MREVVAGGRVVAAISLDIQNAFNSMECHKTGNAKEGFSNIS